MINVIIVDDHPIVRKGIIGTLVECTDINVIADFDHGDGILEILKTHKCDVLLLDISLPKRSGLEILEEVKEIFPSVGVLILSVHSIEQYAIRSLKLGAAGYLNKGSVPEELVSAVRKIANGGKYISAQLAEKIAGRMGNFELIQDHSILSNREFEVMKLIANGEKIKEIAEQLNLSVKTVSTYRERVLKKMNFESNADLVKYALNENIIT